MGDHGPLFAQRRKGDHTMDDVIMEQAVYNVLTECAAQAGVLHFVGIARGGEASLEVVDGGLWNVDRERVHLEVSSVSDNQRTKVRG